MRSLVRRPSVIHPPAVAPALQKTQTHTDTQTHRLTGTQTHKHTQTHTNRHTGTRTLVNKQSGLESKPAILPTLLCIYRPPTCIYRPPTCKYRPPREGAAMQRRPQDHKTTTTSNKPMEAHKQQLSFRALASGPGARARGGAASYPLLSISPPSGCRK